MNHPRNWIKIIRPHLQVNNKNVPAAISFDHTQSSAKKDKKKRIYIDRPTTLRSSDFSASTTMLLSLTHLQSTSTVVCAYHFSHNTTVLQQQ